ncbi:MAG: hypothetical protein WCE54_04230 [Ignavibacteriaceae bacterium]
MFYNILIIIRIVTKPGHSTPVKNLNPAGAWTKPGHGYGNASCGGLECFGEIMKS